MLTAPNFAKQKGGLTRHLNKGWTHKTSQQRVDSQDISTKGGLTRHLNKGWTHKTSQQRVDSQDISTKGGLTRHLNKGWTHKTSQQRVDSQDISTKGGLTRHLKATHGSGQDAFEVDIMDIDELKESINQACTKISENICYPESVRMQFEVPEDIQIMYETLCPAINNLYSQFQLKRDPEYYYRK